jgi:hypothetical protein
MQATYAVACSAGSQELTAVFPSDDDAATNAFTVAIGLPAAPAPQVMFAGQSGNGIGTTPTVVVGQQIVLSATMSLPACMSLESQQWTAPTTNAVGGYTNMDGSGPPDATGGVMQPLPTADAASFTFYWTAAGDPNPRSVSYQYTMTSELGSVTSSPVTANFTVNGPTNVQVFSCGGAITGPCSSDSNLGTVEIDSGPQLRFGNLEDLSNVGIQFSASATAPSGYTNMFQFVQLIVGDTSQLTGCAVLTCHPLITGTNILPGLDTQYLYPQAPGSPSVDDEAGMSLSPIYTKVSRTFSATMYVIWSSGLTNSIPVHLATKGGGSRLLLSSPMRVRINGR